MYPNIFPFAGRRILITGASGFIGSHLCRRLCEQEAEVHAVSRSRRASNGRDEPRWWQGDAADAKFVRELFRTVQPEFVFHLAGETRGKRDLELVLPTFQQNLTTTVNMLLTAAESGCRRVVLAGSLEEPETGKTASSPYAAAHVGIHAYARMFHEIFAAPAVVARMFMVYGPGQEAMQKLIPYVTLALLRGESPKLSSGKRLVDWIYIDDVVEGLLALAQAPEIEGRALDLASGRFVSVREVVEALVRLTGSSVGSIFGAEADRKMETSRKADIEDTFARTGWKPRTPLEEGLRRTITWYEAKLKRRVLESAPVLFLAHLSAECLESLEEITAALGALVWA